MTIDCSLPVIQTSVDFLTTTVKTDSAYFWR